MASRDDLDTTLPLGRLVMPALRWQPTTGYGLGAPWVERVLELGVPGFIVFGGSVRDVAEATEELRERAGRPLVFGSDLERGAGQQFDGAISLPPFAALSALDDPAVMRAAGAVTARGARELGIDWIFGPVADLAIELDNPIVGTRSAGADPEVVSRAVEEWVRGCLEAGAGCCVKHFPGHGRATTDSHADLPVVDASAEELAVDRIPFDRAVAAGVPAVMTAHVAFPVLDPSGLPATRSEPILRMVRQKGFDGLLVSDALIMEAIGDPLEAVVGGVGAGIDLLLYPPDPVGTVEALNRARAIGALSPERMGEAWRRVEELVSRFGRGVGSAQPPDLPDAQDVAHSALWADHSLELTNGPRLATVDRVRVSTFDDDVGGPYATPSRDVLLHALMELGVPMDSQDDAGKPDSCLSVLALYSDPRAWKGRAGVAPALTARMMAEVDRCLGLGEGVLVICFGGRRIESDIDAALGDRSCGRLLAWGGEAHMQRAAARRIARDLARARR